MSAERRTALLALLAAAKEEGVTVTEVRQMTGWHHGQASGALSSLHANRQVARLGLRREGNFIYVLPEYLNGRFHNAVPAGSHRDLAAKAEELEAEREKLWQAYLAGATRFQRIGTEVVRKAFDQWLDAAVSEVDVLGPADTSSDQSMNDGARVLLFSRKEKA